REGRKSNQQNLTYFLGRKDKKTQQKNRQNQKQRWVGERRRKRNVR
uniref:Uncharacterized protein n=1 Tax=Aegilops tauschii subsp. strangulata TaxID=200361 RepID=A0A453QKM4_AEGTS